ncbi:MAG: helix-turn-helix transcriptional regulator [Terriglobia bacterium]
MIPQAPRTDGRIRRIEQLLEADRFVRLTLHELAKSVNLSLSRTQHLFKRETGLSLGQYVKGLRMTKAKSLLENSFLSVKEITAQLGWTSESTFSRDFKACFGISPVKYRSQTKSTPPRLSREAIRLENSRIGIGIAILDYSFRLLAY